MQVKSLAETSVQYVPGVGPVRAKLLARLDIHTIEELLYTPPQRYEDRTRFSPIGQLTPDTEQVVMGTVEQVQVRRARYRRLTIVEVLVSDGTGRLRVTWFNQPYLAQRFTAGQRIVLYGRVEGSSVLKMKAPEHELLGDGEDQSAHMHRIVPIYMGTARLSQRHIREMMYQALARFSHHVVDTLPRETRERLGMCGLVDALGALHFPAAWTDIESARTRLAFDECFSQQLMLHLRRREIDTLSKPQHYQLQQPLATAFLAGLPFVLTAGQRDIMRTIAEDVMRTAPMNRLLQGDVGSGKTVIAIWTLLLAVQSGYQAALMAPTELLVEQHARTLQSHLTPLGVEVVIVSRGTTGAARRALLDRVASGDPLIVLGTHALIQRAVPLTRLGVVVIDEQHKFGVVQRATLRTKGGQPDVLVMTATPIPRTLAMTVYGDLDVATLRELPPGRQPPMTRWFRESQRGELYALLRRALAAGHQAYVVYPAIDESDKMELKAATQMATVLRKEFAEFTVGLVHGRLQPTARRRVMDSFVRGQTQLLVSTVVIEVGIDVPNATVMVLEQAERFGLAQLHQLRGRIGRSTLASVCIAMSDTRGDVATARLEAFVQHQDGFVLAERDLELRGPGETLGTRQSGVHALRFTRLLTDQHIVQHARDEAARAMDQQVLTKHAGDTAHVDQIVQRYHLIDRA